MAFALAKLWLKERIVPGQIGSGEALLLGVMKSLRSVSITKGR